VRCQRICSESISSYTSSADAESAIANLDANYAEIFSSLQRWSREGVNNNLGGGRWWRAADVRGADLPNAISQIEQALELGGAPYLHCEYLYCCVYTPLPILAKDPEGEEIRDYQNAYTTYFNNIFVASPTLRTHRAR